ncbi:MAG: translocation/assembly module TamB domain-containing protein [Elainellaceae cyanobacterium]
MGSPSPETNRDRDLTVRRRYRAGAIVAVAAIATIGGGSWLLQRWVNDNLAPRIEAAITDLIGRPLDLGQTQWVSPVGIRFGPTQLPPTASDFDQATAAAVQVGFNPLEALLLRSLHLTITLIEPRGIVDQTPAGWITTQMDVQEPGLIEFKLDTVRIEAGRFVLIPDPGSPAELQTLRAMAADQLAEGGLFSQPSDSWITLQTSGRGRLSGSERIEFEFEGRPSFRAGRGRVVLEGEADLENARRANLLVQARNLDLEPLLPLLPVALPIELTSGRLNSNLQIRLRDNPGEEPVALNGTARIKDAALRYPPLGQSITGGRARLRFQEQRLTVERASAQVGELPVALSGTAHLREGYNLTAEVSAANIAQVLSTVAVDAPVPLAGQLDATVQVTGDIQSPALSGTLQASGLEVDRLDLGTARARWSTETPITQPRPVIALNAVEVFPAEGGAAFGSGRLQLGAQPTLDLAIQADDIPGDATLRRYWAEAPKTLALGSIDASAQLQGALNQLTGSATWQALQGEFPAQGEIAWQGSQIVAENTTVNIGGGQVALSGEIDLLQQQWQATAEGNQIALGQLPLPEGSLDRLSQLSQSPFARLVGSLERSSAPFDSIVNGTLTVAGPLQARTPSDVTAEGLLRLSNAPLLEQPARAQFSWSGDQLTIQEAIAPDLRVAGQIDIPFTGWQPALGNLDLDVTVDEYDLARIAPFSKTVQVQGVASFDGQVTGPLEALRVSGQSQFADLAINDIILGTLAGTIAFSPEGSEVDLSGPDSTIAATLDEAQQPLAFQVQQGETQIEGKREGDRLTAAVRQFPLTALNLKPAGRIGQLGGDVSGDLVIDWRSLQNQPLNDWRAALRQMDAVGEIVVDNPRLGYIAGRQVRGQVQLADGIIRLQEGALQVGRSRYGISGQLAIEPELAARGKIVAEEGYVQDLLLALQIFDLEDFARGLSTRRFGSAETLDSPAIGAADRTLQQQLQRYAEIQALQQQADGDSATRLPPLSQLDGNFSGTIDVALSNRELSADFALAGEDWRWGPYDDRNQLIAQGSISEGTLTLLPLRFTSGETQLNFAGTLGNTDEALGQLRAENVSAEFIQDFFAVPIDLDGDLNATATLSGSITNPQARGEINFADATLNGNDVEAAAALFSYGDARLNLIGQMRLDGTDPLRVEGSFPYRLPQATVTPEDNSIRLSVNLENDGLGLLNLVNNQVRWEGGTGRATLDIGGTLDQTPAGLDIDPLVRGAAVFDDAAFSASFVPGTLTGVTGTIEFISDRIEVNGLEGEFSDGRVTAQGTIPLATPDSGDRSAPPLKVDLEDLAINLKGLYNGDADGRIQISGAALAPEIRGEIFLSNGRISLPNVDPDAPPAPAAYGIFQPPILDDLRVVLGDRLLVTRAPILNFVADGDIRVSGPLTEVGNLRPEGTIRLRSGQVNLLTSQFNLIRRYDNIARFLGSADPFLDVRLETSVFEQTRQFPRSRDPFRSSEVRELPTQRLGELQTVQIRATVQGPASRLFNNIELSSSPSRSDAEILALLGGVGSETGDSSGALALAGSALFTSLQTLVSNTLGITNFRIFPAIITEDDREERSADDADPTLGLAAELGINLTEDLSISALQLLTVREPTQFGLRYRISDELQLRSSTNFSDDSRVVIEFNRQF